MNYASFWRRFFASWIDNIILLIPSLLMGTSINSIPGSLGFSLILGILYFSVFECSEMSGTPGKALLNIAVVNEDGARVSFKAAVVRYLARYLSWAIAGIGYLMQPFTSKKQTLHDMLTETVVINKESADLNYFTVWRDQFKAIIGQL